jgi:hypothetical protein
VVFGGGRVYKSVVSYFSASFYTLSFSYRSLTVIYMFILLDQKYVLGKDLALFLFTLSSQLSGTRWNSIHVY